MKKKADDNLEKIMNRKNDEMAKKCTFKPEISSNSKELLQNDKKQKRVPADFNQRS